ncbi:Ger(x)C family spore germination protein [Peribacillus kribbensis]|uniref:Ger(x)C family spore germination protein n=1 Tax=Peribacillus kribbensis TaxID=356658 RepID=UPI000479DF6C|nr:Ger(x)C family spore germination protein [Peribacillus kribbensis]
MKQVIVSICVMILLSGCNIRDVEKRAFVVTLGVDKAKEKDKVLVSFKTALPSGDPKAGLNQFSVVTVKAGSVAEAVRIAKSRLDKELDFGHTSVIILGRDLLRENVRPVIFWAQRRRDIQMISYIGLGQPTAKDVLAVKPVSERSPAGYLRNLMSREGSESPFVVNEYLFDLQRKIMEYGWDPVLPVVKAEKDKLVIERAVLMNDDKVMAELTPDETRLYNLLANENIASSYTARVKGKIEYTIHSENSKAKYKIISGTRPKIEFQVKVNGVLEEDRTPGFFDKDKEIQASKIIEKSLNKRIKSTLVKFQKHGVDPLGIGLRYQATHWSKREREAWSRMYPKAEFEVRTTVKIHSTGIIR